MALPAMSDLLTLVREAGALARRHARNVTAERKPDRTLVTAADRAVEEFLVAGLLAAAPGARILGEEFGVAGTLDSPHTLTVDPIDGTAAFVSGLPTWCVTVGLVSDARALGGITYLPMTEETYIAENGIAHWNGHAIPRGQRPPTEHDRFIVTYSEYHRGRRIRFPGKMRSLGSTAYHLALVARGAAAAALLGRPRIWDLAAGAALLDAVGGALRYRSGEAVDLAALVSGERAPDQIVAAAPGMMDEMLALVQEAEAS